MGEITNKKIQIQQKLFFLLLQIYEPKKNKKRIFEPSIKYLNIRLFSTALPVTGWLQYLKNRGYLNLVNCSRCALGYKLKVSKNSMCCNMGTIWGLGLCHATWVSWPSGLVHWTQVLMLSECGFESWPGRSRCLCPWARHLTIIASSFGWDVKL